jgi:hypothetical protein
MWTLVVPFPCPWPRFGGAFSCWPAAVAGLVIRSRPHFLATSAPLTGWRRQRPLRQAVADGVLSDTKELLAFRRPGRPLGATAGCPGMERNVRRLRLLFR